MWEVCVLVEECRLAVPVTDHCFLITDLCKPVVWCGAQARYRAISTGQLHGLPRFHLRPINVVVYHGSQRDLVLR